MIFHKTANLVESLSALHRDILRYESSKIIIISDNHECKKILIKHAGICASRMPNKALLISELLAREFFFAAKLSSTIKSHFAQKYKNIAFAVRKFLNDITYFSFNEKNEIIEYAKKFFAEYEDIFTFLDCASKVKNGDLIANFIQLIQGFFGKIDEIDFAIPMQEYSSHQELYRILQNAYCPDINGNHFRNISLHSPYDEINLSQNYDKIYYFECIPTLSTKYFDLATAECIVHDSDLASKLQCFAKVSGFEIKQKNPEVFEIQTQSFTKPALYPNNLNSGDNMSYTKFKTYLDNPHDFYVKYILNIEPSSQNYGKLGILCHNFLSTLVAHYNTSNDKSNFSAKKIFNDVIHAILLNLNDGIERLMLIDRAKQIARICEDIFEFTNLHNCTIETEKSYIYEHQIGKKTIKINIKPDLIITYPEGFIIYDLKTGANDHKNLTIQAELTYKSPQLLFYSLIFHKISSIKPKNFGYIYCNNNKTEIIDYADIANKLKSPGLDKEIELFDAFFTEKIHEIMNNPAFFHPEFIDQSNFNYYIRQE